jgi:hypothetical protein
VRRERGEGTNCKEEEDKSSTKAQRRDESMCAKMVARAERRPVSTLETFTNNRDGWIGTLKTHAKLVAY